VCKKAAGAKQNRYATPAPSPPAAALPFPRGTALERSGRWNLANIRVIPNAMTKK
jgi:hypothetical protein